jgi:hypothetical protein
MSVVVVGKLDPTLGNVRHIIRARYCDLLRWLTLTFMPTPLAMGGV